MLARNNLLFWRVTSVGQKIPPDATELSESFLAPMQCFTGFDQMFNMDETPCYFELPASTTLDFCGVNTVKPTLREVIFANLFLRFFS